MRPTPPVTDLATTGISASRCALIPSVMVSFLPRLAKHLALLACLAIVGRTTGRFEMSEFAIFLLIVAATLLQIVGRRLARFLPISVPDDCRAP